MDAARPSRCVEASAVGGVGQSGDPRATSLLGGRGRTPCPTEERSGSKHENSAGTAKAERRTGSGRIFADVDREDSGIAAHLPVATTKSFTGSTGAGPAD